MFETVQHEERWDGCLIGMIAVGQFAWGVVLALSIRAVFHILNGG